MDYSFYHPRSNYATIRSQPTLREIFFNSDLGRLPEFIGFMSTLHHQRMIVDQLRRENAVKRISVSQAVDNIKIYIGNHAHEDSLLVGFSSQKANPFREKSSCSLL